MKSSYPRMIIISFLVSLTFSCEDKLWDNPNDANTTLDPSEWAPKNLRAQVLNDSQIKLTWIQDEKRIEGIRIERSENSSSWEQIVDLGADLTQYTDTGLSYGPNYTYRVSAYTTSNQSGSALSKETSTIFPAPTDLTATAQNDTDILLEWTDNCDFEEGFRIDRREDGSSWVHIGEVAADVTQYIDSGLNNVYDYRVYAYTANNVSEYSNSVVAGFVTDIDGNTYQTVKIGDQLWMAENLKVTHYRNGEAIASVTDNAEWGNLSTGAYCNYDNDANNATTYGNLYNWFTVNDSSNIAPEGWHVPSDDEWKEMEMFLGMSQSEADDIFWRGTNEGGKLKETGTEHWTSPNTGATNESGFSALPGGYRRYSGSGFEGLGDHAYFWSSTERGSREYAEIRNLDYNSSEVYRSAILKQVGFSVRCVRD